MIQPQKEAIIIAGANGVGKTTFAREFLRENPDYSFLNADEIAGELSAGRPETSPLTAGKVLFERLTSAIQGGRQFILETYFVWQISCPLYTGFARSRVRCHFDIPFFRFV